MVRRASSSSPRRAITTVVAAGSDARPLAGGAPSANLQERPGSQVVSLRDGSRDQLGAAGFDRDRHRDNPDGDRDRHTNTHGQIARSLSCTRTRPDHPQPTPTCAHQRDQALTINDHGEVALYRVAASGRAPRHAPSPPGGRHPLPNIPQTIHGRCALASDGHETHHGQRRRGCLATTKRLRVGRLWSMSGKDCSKWTDFGLMLVEFGRFQI